ncbi:MAG: hypothetical protein HYY05_07250 [Chloroflexi bacterium]|nr:hypothetical protein [Chloroflexota bacterium]
MKGAGWRVQETVVVGLLRSQEGQGSLAFIAVLTVAVAAFLGVYVLGGSLVTDLLSQATQMVEDLLRAVGL